MIVGLDVVLVLRVDVAVVLVIDAVLGVVVEDDDVVVVVLGLSGVSFVLQVLILPAGVATVDIGPLIAFVSAAFVSPSTTSNKNKESSPLLSRAVKAKWWLSKARKLVVTVSMSLQPWLLFEISKVFKFQKMTEVSFSPQAMTTTLLKSLFKRLQADPMRGSSNLEKHTRLDKCLILNMTSFTYKLTLDRRAKHFFLYYKP